MSVARLLCLVISTMAVALVIAPAQAKEGVKADADGITVNSPERDFELNLGGRLQFESMRYDDGAQQTDEDDFRRERVELSGRIGDRLRFRVDREFANVDGWRNVWMSFRPTDNTEVKGGNFLVPFSMEDLQSSNRIALIERSAMSALTPGYSAGAATQFTRRGFTASAGYFSDGLDDEDGRTEERGKGVAGRVTFAPIRDKGQVLHIGAAVEHRSFHTGDVVRFQVKPGSALAPTLLRTGSISQPDQMSNLGAELAWSHGDFLFQSQYVATSLTRETRSTLNFDAWYAQVSWVISGQHYEYSTRSGMFTGVELKRGKGAIELAARYSSADLSDTDFDRGEATILTLGLNYYLNENLRFMVNYSHASAEDVSGTRDRNTDVVSAGVQLNF